MDADEFLSALEVEKLELGSGCWMATLKTSPGLAGMGATPQRAIEDLRLVLESKEHVFDAKTFRILQQVVANAVQKNACGQDVGEELSAIAKMVDVSFEAQS